MKSLTASFTPVDQTLTIAETYYFSGSDCTFTVPIQQSVEAGGTTYYANPVTVTPAGGNASVPVTYHYPSMTLDSLSTINNPAIVWVRSLSAMLTFLP